MYLRLRYKGMFLFYYNQHLKVCLSSDIILTSDIRILPGHGGTLQASVFVAFPSHFPLFASFTNLFLVLVRVAFPQVAEQAPLFHSPQTQSTRKSKFS